MEEASGRTTEKASVRRMEVARVRGLEHVLAKVWARRLEGWTAVQ